MSNRSPVTMTPNEERVRSLVAALNGTTAHDEACRLIYRYRTEAMALAVRLVSYDTRAALIDELRGKLIVCLDALAAEKGVSIE